MWKFSPNLHFMKPPAPYHTAVCSLQANVLWILAFFFSNILTRFVWKPVHASLPVYAYNFHIGTASTPTARWRNFETQLYFYGLAYCPHLSITTTELFNSAFHTGGISKRRLCVLVRTKNILKTTLFVMIIPCPSFTQIQMQYDRWLLRFAAVWRENIRGVLRVKPSFSFPST